MRGRNFLQAHDLAYRMLLGYDCEVVESKRLLGNQPNMGSDKVVAKGLFTIWYVCPSREQAQNLFDEAKKIYDDLQI